MTGDRKKTSREWLVQPTTAGYGLVEKNTITDPTAKPPANQKSTEKKITTPKGSWLVVPEENLAAAIASEYQSLPPRGRFFAPLAMTVIDTIAPHRPPHRAAFLSAMKNDTILFVPADNRDLQIHLTRQWQAIWDWVSDYSGAALATTSDLTAPALPPQLVARVEQTVDGWSDWLAGGIFYLAGLVQSPLIALFALHHPTITAEKIFAHGFAEQEYQTSRWGEDKVVQEKKMATIDEIKKTQKFLQFFLGKPTL